MAYPSCIYSLIFFIDQSLHEFSQESVERVGEGYEFGLSQRVGSEGKTRRTGVETGADASTRGGRGSSTGSG